MKHGKPDAPPAGQQARQAPPMEPRELAEAVRSACLKAAVDAHEQAAISGLCREGAWECALGAIRSLDLDTIIP